MLDIESLHFQAENPNLISVLYTVLCALGLGLVLAFTYHQTTHPVNRHNHFLQALVLVTIVAATIIQAIGDSVARGLGMLGALSIIRFRTTLRDPRNIVFMFGALAAGIACGVFGFTIAIGGTLSFCLTAFILKYTLPQEAGNLKGQLELSVSQSCTTPDLVEKRIKKRSSNYRIDRYGFKPGKMLVKKAILNPDGSVLTPEYSMMTENVKSYRYLIHLNKESDFDLLKDDLEEIEGVTLKGLTCSSISTEEL